eukprot:TRINITY_DN492_c0_g1_i1.p1 TRINITY_DN492_c0_g1~~TRINITY_DN492_c0_g1_i1.p1  ORF type:complete len:577 (-),score=128.99 TRINITY_DN492_c0_g1_i1:972-2702(-)
MQRGLVGSEMCIRDRYQRRVHGGEGRFMIIAVGEISCVGKVLATLKDKPTQTPLQKKLGGVADFIGKIGLYTAIVTVAVLIIRYLISRIAFGGWSTDDIATIFEFFVLGITVLIVAIPEGLPLAVTIALAYSVGQMYNENNFVKTMMSCEVMGNANYICSDKTGTLTKNEMTVVQLWFDEKEILVEQILNKDDLIKQIDIDNIDLIAEAIVCNTLSGENGGNETERACLKFVEKYEYKEDDIRKRYIEDKKYNRFFFTSQRKKMSTIIEKDTSLHRLYIKGASEKVLDACSHFQSKGRITKISNEMRSRISNSVDRFNKSALRTISVAYRELRPDEFGPEHNQIGEGGKYIVEEDKLTLLCVLGIRDVLRDGVQNAVEKCRHAGINVMMVTGDNPTTAKAIAKNCQIYKLQTNNSVMEGEAFCKMLGGLFKYCNECQKEISEKEYLEYKEKKRKEEQEKKEEEKKKKEEEKTGGGEGEGEGEDEDDEPPIEKQEIVDECPHCNKQGVIEKVRNIEKFKEIHKDLCVLARSRPTDKLLLVTALKELGNIVAVTGDGTNDAPALRKADVGFCYGYLGH